MEPKLDIIKDFVKDYSPNIIQHLVCVNRTILFGTNQGEILVLNKQQEIKQCLRIQDWSQKQVSILIALEQGFLCSNGKPRFRYFKYEGKDPKSLYTKESDLQLQHDAQLLIRSFVSYEGYMYFVSDKGILHRLDLALMAKSQQQAQD